MGALQDRIRRALENARQASARTEAERAADIRRAAMAGETADVPIPPRRTPFTANPLLEALDVANVEVPQAGSVDPATLARLSQTETFSQIPYQISPAERADVLVRSAVDATGRPVMSETGVRPTRLVRRRSKSEGGSDAERMWVTPTGDGRFQITSDGGTTLDTVATEDQVRDLLTTGGWSWDSGPKLDVPDSLPDPQMVGRALLEYSRDAGNVANLERAVSDLELLRRADQEAYNKAIGVAGGGAIFQDGSGISDLNMQQGLQLAENAARAVSVASDSPAAAGRVPIGEADVPTTAAPSAQELAARIAAAARSPLGVRLPTNDLSTQIQVGGGAQPPMANAVTEGADLLRPNESIGGFGEPDSYALTPQDQRGAYRPIVRYQLPEAQLGAEVPIGVSNADVGIAGGRRRSMSEDVGAAGEGFVAPQDVPPGPLDPMPGPEAMAPESPTMDARSSSILDDLLPGGSQTLQGSMAFQINPGSWAADMFGARRDDLAALIREAQGSAPFTFSTADMPVQSASDFVASLPPDVRARWGASGMPRTGGVNVAQMPVTLRPSAVRDVSGPTYSADFVPIGGGDATIPRFITDEELALAFTRQQPAPGERFITNNDPGLSTGTIEDVERRLEELVQLRQALEARASFAEQAAQQGRMTIAELNKVRSGVMNDIARLDQEYDGLIDAGVDNYISAVAAGGDADDLLINQDPGMMLYADKQYVLDNIQRLRDQLASTRPERMAAEGAARKRRNVMDDRSTEMRDAASNVQDEISRLTSILRSDGATYSTVDQDALRRAAEKELVDQAADAAVLQRDANQISEANSLAGLAASGDAPVLLSADQLRDIANDVLTPKRDPAAVDADGRSAATGDKFSLPAAFGAYDARMPNSRPSKEFVEEIARRQQEIEDLMPADSALLSEEEIEDIVREQLIRQRQLETEIERVSGSGSTKVRKSAGAAQAAMVEKLMSGSREERLAALNDLFGTKRRGSYEVFKDPETGEILQRGQNDDAGQLVIKDRETGEWRPFDAERDASRRNEARPERFNPMPVRVSAIEGGLDTLARIAAHPAVGSKENLLFNVLRQNSALANEYSPEALWAAAKQLASEAESVMPRSAPDAGARVGVPSFTQRLQSAIQDFSLGRPTDFVPETTPVDELVNLLPDADGLQAAEPGMVSRELSQVRFIAERANALEEQGYDVTRVREAIDRIMPALEEAYRPMGFMPTKERAPEIELSRDPEVLQSQIEALKRSIDQASAEGDAASVQRLTESLQLRRGQLASVQQPGRLGGDDAAMRGANADVAPVLHTSERPSDFVSVGAFSIPIDSDVGDALRNALSGELYPGQSGRAVGAPEVEILTAPPRTGPDESVPHPVNPGVFVRRPSQIPQATIRVRRKYAGGIEPVREFTVDIAQPGEVRPGSATLELGEDGRSFFFVNKNGSDPLPSASEAADAASAAEISEAAEDQALREARETVGGGQGMPPGREIPATPRQRQTQQQRLERRLNKATTRQQLSEAERQALEAEEAAARVRQSRSGDPASRTEEEAPAVTGRRYDYEGDEGFVYDDPPPPRGGGSGRGSGETASPTGKKGAVKKGVAGAVGLGLAGLGGKLGYDLLAASEAQAAPILASTLAAEQSPEDTNSTDRMLDRVRRARQYQSYLVSGHMMPR